MLSDGAIAAIVGGFVSTVTAYLAFRQSQIAAANAKEAKVEALAAKHEVGIVKTDVASVHASVNGGLQKIRDEAEQYRLLTAESSRAEGIREATAIGEAKAAAVAQAVATVTAVAAGKALETEHMNGVKEGVRQGAEEGSMEGVKQDLESITEKQKDKAK